MESLNLDEYQDISKLNILDKKDLNKAFVINNTFNNKMFSDDDEEVIQNIKHKKRVQRAENAAVVSSGSDEHNDTSEEAIEKVTKRLLSEIREDPSLLNDDHQQKKFSYNNNSVKTLNEKQLSEDEFGIDEFNSQEELQSSMKTSTAQNSPMIQNKSPFKKRSSWVQCDRAECQKWRRIDHVDDLSTIADGKWICCMNDDEKRNKCDATQETIPSENEDEDSSYTSYKPGALVLGKMAGYPWWPGIVEDDPDYESFFYLDRKNDKVVLSYHVTFFGKDVSRAWLTEVAMTTFDGHETLQDVGTLSYSGTNFSRAVSAALEDAKKAIKMIPEKRIQKYGFLRRYKRKYRQTIEDKNGYDAVEVLKKTQNRQTQENKDPSRTSIPSASKTAIKGTVHHGKLTARKIKEANELSKEAHQLSKETNQSNEKYNRMSTKKKGKNESKKRKTVKDLTHSSQKKNLKEKNGEWREETSMMHEDKLLEKTETEADERIADISTGSTVGQDVVYSEEIDVKKLTCETAEKVLDTVNCGEKTIEGSSVHTTQEKISSSQDITGSQNYAGEMIGKYVDKGVLDQVLIDVDPQKQKQRDQQRKEKEEKSKLRKDKQEAKKKEQMSIQTGKKVVVSSNLNICSEKKKLNKKKDQSVLQKPTFGKQTKTNKTTSAVTNNVKNDEIIPKESAKTKSSDEKAANTIKKSELSFQGEEEGKIVRNHEKDNTKVNIMVETEEENKRFQLEEQEVEVKSAALQKSGDLHKAISPKKKQKTKGEMKTNDVTKVSGSSKDTQKPKKTIKEKQNKALISENHNNSSCVKKSELPKLVKPTLPSITVDEIIKNESKSEKHMPKLKKPSFKAPVKSESSKRALPSYKAPSKQPGKRSNSDTDGSVEPPKKKVAPEVHQNVNLDLDNEVDLGTMLTSRKQSKETNRDDAILHDSPEF